MRRSRLGRVLSNEDKSRALLNEILLLRQKPFRYTHLCPVRMRRGPSGRPIVNPSLPREPEKFEIEAIASPSSARNCVVSPQADSPKNSTRAAPREGRTASVYK